MATKHRDMVPLNVIALRTWVVFVVVTGGGFGLLFLYAIRSVLLQLVIALVLAIALAPFAAWLQRHKFNRVMASVAALLATIVVVLALVAAIASPLVTQGGDLVHNAPQLAQKATHNATFRKLDDKYHIVQRVEDASKSASKDASGSGSVLLGALGSVVSGVEAFVVVLILTLFLLMEGPTAWEQFIKLLGKPQADFVTTVSGKITKAVSGFVNGNLLISVIAGVVTLITLLITGVPYAFALAATVAVFDLIPLVGAAIGTIIVGLVALTKGIVVALIVVALLLLYQFLEGHLIQPIIYGRTVQLSQLLIILASVIGALLGGIVGVLLTIPIAAALQIIVVELLRAAGADIEPEVARSVKAAK